MKCKSIAILIFCASVPATVLAQRGDDEIGGAGTANFIPRFTSAHKLEDSNIFQAGSNVGVNTTSPQATLDVQSTRNSGILGTTSSAGENGVSGNATSTAEAGIANGVYGQTASTGFGAGVSGNAIATTGNAYGVFGQSAAVAGVGVFGYEGATSGYTSGVFGFVESPNGTAGSFVNHSGSGLILHGLSGSSFTQVFAVDASGNAFFAGNLTKSSGSFKIDHPLDPANKYLSHSFIESPDMMNVYNGVIVLDALGSAWVELPDYFQALNRDYRYQLTSIGAPGPNLHIAKEVSDNRFKIAGGKPGGKVSWQVTGIRQDAYANVHRVAVEEEKPPAARGQYLHPELFGASKEQAIGAVHFQVGQPVVAATGGTTR